MLVKDIEWLDKEGKEAILEVVSETESLRCFSCPCFCNIGDTLNEPLECLDVENIIMCDKRENIISKMEGSFKYKIKGKLTDKQNGFIEASGFQLHIDEDRIPKDLENGMYIQFVVSRIDIW